MPKFAEACVEALDATCGVHDALLTGVERVRLGRDFNLDDRVLVAVFPLLGLVRGHGGTGQKTLPDAGSRNRAQVVVRVVSAFIDYLLLLLDFAGSPYIDGVGFSMCSYRENLRAHHHCARMGRAQPIKGYHLHGLNPVRSLAGANPHTAAAPRRHSRGLRIR